jgi:arylsulfatase A
MRIANGIVCAIALFCVLLGPSRREARAESTPPNILFLMADDLGYGDLGCYNKASKIPTPNLDRLATQGMRFTDAHSPSAVCTPTRYGVLTGRYCWRSRLKKGVLWGYSPALIEPGRVTVASLLKDRGYVTACIGKWHLGLGAAERTDYAKPLRPGPLQVGFDSFFGIPASLDMDPYVYVENEGVVEAPSKRIAASKMRRVGGGGFWRAGPIAPSFKHEDVLPTITRKAIAFLEEHARTRRDTPFFFYFPLTAPHTPWMPTKEFRGKSRAGYYGDFTVQVDWTVGQVMQALDRLKLADNTLLIVTSDNGAHWKPEDIKKYQHRANGSLRGQKADIWEGGHRIPFLVRWPGKVKAGSVSHQTICHTDLLATCAEVVGVDVPAGAGEDSASYLPVLLGKQPEEKAVHEAVVHHSSRGIFAIRQGNWKLIEGLGSGGFSKPAQIKPTPFGPRGQLYDLARDPAEADNLYLKRPEIVARLHALLERYKEQGYSVSGKGK